MQAHSDAFVAKQDLQVFNAGSVGLQVLVSESVAKTVRTESCPLQPRTTGDAFHNLAYTVHSKGVVAADAVGSSPEKQRLGACLLRTLAHQIFEDSSLRLRVKFNSTVFVALPPDSD